MAESNSEKRIHSSNPAATPQTDFQKRDLIFHGKSSYGYDDFSFCHECLRYCYGKKRHVLHCYRRRRGCYCDYRDYRYIVPHFPLSPKNK